MMSLRPDARASSTPYWMIGLSTNGSISFGCALVAGRNRVPSPAAGKTALRTACIGIVNLPAWYLRAPRSRYRILIMLDPAYVRDHVEEVRAGLRNRGLDPAPILEPFALLDAKRRELIPRV